MEFPLHRKLLEATDSYTESCTTCVYAPSPVVTDGSSSSSSSPHTNHAIPYVVSAACALGVAFLILTTCTILLRNRCARRRTSLISVASSRDSTSFNEDRSPVDHPIWHIVTVGLPQSVIDSIEAVKYKSSDGLIEEPDCSVCLTEFEDGDDVRLLPKCSHAFHLPCIDTWLRSHKNCPLCRSTVLNHSDSNPNSTINDSETARIDNSDSVRETAEEDDDDEFDTLPLQGSVWKSDPTNLSSGYFQGARRSMSLDSSAAVDNAGGEGSSHSGEETDREGSGLSRLIKTSSSIGRSLSSSAKILSPFRGSKSHSSSSSSSTLP